MHAEVIRRATTEDVSAIVAIWRQSMALHGRRDPTFRPRRNGHVAFGRFVSERIADPQAAVIIAVASGELAAYGICVLRERSAYLVRGRHGLVTDLDVHAAHRRRGLGEQVLEALCDWLRQQEVRRVEAEVVAANDIAVGFWRKRGFTPYYLAVSRSL